jgi:hypothetical protein
MHIPELDKPAGQKCQHDNGRCSIYAERPQSCRAYNCFWLRGDLFRTKKKTRGKGRDPIESLRPDRIGVIFDNAVSVERQTTTIVAREVQPGAFVKQRALLDRISRGRTLVCMPAATANSEIDDQEE